MALLYHKLHRVPSGVSPLGAGQKAAPGFVVGLVEGVALGSDLEDDGVDAGFSQRVESFGEGCLHLSLCHSLKLTVDGCYPCSAEFSLGEYGL